MLGHRSVRRTAEIKPCLGLAGSQSRGLFVFVECHPVELIGHGPVLVQTGNHPGKIFSGIAPGAMGILARRIDRQRLSSGFDRLIES